MSFSPVLAEKRFGCGLSPVLAMPASPQALLESLTGPDRMAERFPIETFDVFGTRMVQADSMRKRMKETRGTPAFKAARKEYNLQNKAAREAMVRWYGQTMLRWTWTEQGFRERLAMFWGDHFTALGKQGVSRRATSAFVESAIRPNMTGRFSDLVIAATTHPLMLMYLDQTWSVGPSSEVARKRGKARGLNENLAREVLELHTLGVNGPYTQDDVRQLAELFTGMTFQPQVGFKYRKDFAEPGSETVLGVTYGGDPARLDPILDALRDLAGHPATGRHIAWKLAVHFVSDNPDPALIDHIATRFLETDGDLLAVYAALIEHPAAWDTKLNNIKPPSAFVGSSLRALAVQPEMIEKLDEKQTRRTLLYPMTKMGETWQKPVGPDGWPEEDTEWLTPQGLAARMRWALTKPRVLRPDLPDPRVFVEQALGPELPEAVRFAAAAAESRAEAIGLVLSSPAFQRR